jgi:hypothetical protein
MTGEAPDVHQTLEYRFDTAIVRLLPTGLLLCFLGLLTFVLIEGGDPPLDMVLAGCVLVAAGFGLTAFALWRRQNPGRPLFWLSPTGVHYRIAWVKTILVPWHEIKDIDTIAITTWNGSFRHPGTMTFYDVTAILVSQQFYDAHIHLGSFLLRGPAWKNIFIPKGPLVQIALHHEAASTDPGALRAAVEARWRAFRDHVPEVRSAISFISGAGRRRASGIVAAGESPRRVLSHWEKVKILVPAIGIAVVLSNILGLWATSGQIAAREERRKWNEWNQKREEETRKLDEEMRKTRQRLDDAFRRR